MFVPGSFRRRDYLLTPSCPAENEGGGDEGGGGGDDKGGDDKGGGGREYTAPATQEEFDARVKDRIARAKKSGYDEASAKYKPGHDKHEELEAELGSETDKKVHAAREEEKTNARNSFGTKLVRQAFRAEAKGVLTDDQRDGLLEDLDLTKYLDDDGEVDEDKVAAKVKKIAGDGKKDDTDDHGKGGGRGLGQGRRQPADAKPGDAGRARAAKRFPKKSE